MKAWQQFLSLLEQELEPQVVEKWLKPLKVIRFDARNLYLEAQDSFQISWFEEHVRPRLKEELFNNNQLPVKVHLEPVERKKSVEPVGTLLPIPEKSMTLSHFTKVVSTAPYPPDKDILQVSKGRQQKGKIVQKGDFPRAPVNKEPLSPLSFKSDPIDPEMTFEHFVPSPENLMPYKLLSEETQGFNPIYLYGPAGAGKTHLLMGVAAQLQKKGKRVFFVRAETFTGHVVQAIRLGLMQDFRKVYREIDVLIIDDIHIFSKKNATQEEFFHTFNTLHTLGCLILLSANVAPSQLREIEPRLISRFEWGITLGLEKGDRKTVLKKKAALWQTGFSEDLIQFLLEKFSRDPILALQALALRSLGKGAVNRDIASHLLHDLLAKEEENTLTSEKVIKAIAAYYGIRSEDLIGKSQMREYALPRQVAMYVCREKLKIPFQKIGEIFDRNHSTVMSSVKQIQKAVEEKKSEIVEAIGSIASL